MKYRSHGYAGQEDMDAMLQLVSASWRRSGIHNRYHIGDVYWGLGTQREETPDQPYSQVRLWATDTGTTVGFAWLEDAETGDILVHPDHRNRGIEMEMLDWIEEYHRLVFSQLGSTTSLRIGGYEDAQWQLLLIQRGYMRDQEMPPIPHFWRSLDDIVSEQSPDGFIVRSVAGKHEATERTMAARAAFSRLDFQWLRLLNPTSDQVPIEPDKSEVERRTRIYKNVMRLRGYRRDLDIVAVAGDGEFVAFCTCWLDAENKTGLFEPVGCVQGYRRRGLTQAVINEGLRRLKALGAESAVVGTNPLNVPAIRLYESCGFRISFTDFTYCKTFKD